jgi:hypothetical protein
LHLPGDSRIPNESRVPNPKSRLVLALALALLLAPALSALKPDVLRSTGAIPAHVAGRFREATGFQQSASGQYFVFDRRAHTVFGVDEAQSSSWEIIQIGAESGRIIDPSAFAVEPNGTFVVADAPNGRERIQIFTPAGFRIGGFLLPGRMRPRVTLESFVLNGIGSLQYTGTSILMSQPETGGLITEYTLGGIPNRTIGNLRRTGYEQDRELHFALNSGIPLVDPSGGFLFVFQTGEPVFQKYDRDGGWSSSVASRVRSRRGDQPAPTTWPRRKTDEGELRWSHRRFEPPPSIGAASCGSRSSRRSPTSMTRTATRRSGPIPSRRPDDAEQSLLRQERSPAGHAGVV